MRSTEMERKYLLTGTQYAATRFDIDFNRANILCASNSSICVHLQWFNIHMHSPTRTHCVNTACTSGCAVKACVACFISIKTIIAVLLQAVLSGRHDVCLGAIYTFSEVETT